MGVYLNCAPRTVTKVEYRVEYRDVLQPVRCNVTIPPWPVYNGDPVMGVVDLCEFTEKVLLLLNTCIGNDTVPPTPLHGSAIPGGHFKIGGEYAGNR